MPVTLGLVPARSGSKGIPHKNLRPFAGKPLWLWAWDIARACDESIVSTDYDLTAPRMVRRPAELCQDDTPMLHVIQHALGCSSADVIVLLQPTSPLRKPEHVEAALKLLEETGADSVVSVVEIPRHYSPDLATVKCADGRLRPWDVRPDLTPSMDLLPTTRQAACPAYVRDGTVYAIRRETIEAGSLYGRDCRALVIPPEESATLDTEDDWKRAEALMEARLNGG